MAVGVVHRDDQSAPFFDAAAGGTLLIRRCEACGHVHPPEATRCTRCSSPDLAWVPASGEGTVVTWAVAHGRAPSGGGPAPRTVFGIVELDEGPWMQAQLPDADPADLASGDRVRVGFERAEGGEPVPVFRTVTG